jgi:hypothetical protein
MAGGTERLKDELFHQLTAYLEKLMVLLCAVSNIFKVAKCFSGYGDGGSSHEKNGRFFLHPCPSVRRPFAPNPSVSLFSLVCAGARCATFHKFVG